MAEIAVKPGELADACSRARPGDTVILGDGVYRETIRPAVVGTASAPITFRARNAGKAILDGGETPTGWTKDSQGTWSVPWSKYAFGVFQDDYEAVGKHACLWDMVYNQYNSNSDFEIDADGVSQFKVSGGRLRVRTVDGKNPSEHRVRAAVLEAAVNLNGGRSGVVLEGLVFLNFKHWIASGGGPGLWMRNCQCRFAGSTGAWFVDLNELEATGCVFQGGGSWSGHYEDVMHLQKIGKLRFNGNDISYGGHSGMFFQAGRDGGDYNVTGCHFHDMGGSLVTLKRNVNGIRFEGNWFTEAAKSTAVNAHKVPHAGFQLSGNGHQFRNCKFSESGIDILASSDGNADSNPVCSDILFERCSFSGSEMQSVQGQEYAPNGRMERMVWRDCVIQKGVELFLAGRGDKSSNLVQHSQVNGPTRGVVLKDSGSSALPNTGSTLGDPPSPGVPVPVPPAPGPQPPQPLPPQPPPAVGETIITALEPATGQVGTVVIIRGRGFGTHPLVIVSADIPGGLYRLTDSEIRSAADTKIEVVMPRLVKSGSVYVRGIGTSNKVEFTAGDGPSPAGLSVIVTAESRASGGLATATITDAAPLPRGTKVAVTVTRPDGKAATGEKIL